MAKKSPMNASAKTFRLVASEIHLDESPKKATAVSTEVQIIRCGKFEHPEYGKFEIKPEHLRSFKENFDKRARGIDLAIDYAHESDKIAAGWITDVELKEGDTELWAKVRWTEKARKLLADREYRYLSADFSFDYKGNENGEKFGPTLFGAGLTNRPVIKEMEPVVELTELKKGDSKMDLSELQAKTKKLELELADAKAALAKATGKKKPAPVKSADQPGADSKIAELEARIAKLESGDSDQESEELDEGTDQESEELDEGTDQESEELDEGDEQESEELDEGDEQESEELDEDSDQESEELDEDAVENDEGDDEMADKDQKAAAKAKQPSKLKAKKLAEVRGKKFERLLSEGRVCRAQKAAFLSGDMVKFAELAKPAKLKASGHGKDADESSTANAEDQILTLAQKAVKDGAVKTLSEGIQLAISKNPDLRKSYERKFK